MCLRGERMLLLLFKFNRQNLLMLLTVASHYWLIMFVKYVLCIFLLYLIQWCFQRWTALKRLCGVYTNVFYKYISRCILFAGFFFCIWCDIAVKWLCITHAWLWGLSSTAQYLRLPSIDITLVCISCVFDWPKAFVFSISESHRSLVSLEAVQTCVWMIQINVVVSSFCTRSGYLTL